jgi:hypothetical protein
MRLAVLPCLANERDSAPRIVERDVVADLLQVNFGLWCEVRAHSLRAVFGHFDVLALQTVKYLGGGFGLPLRRPLSISSRRLSIIACRRC